MNRESTLVTKLSELTCVDEVNLRSVLDLVEIVIEDTINETINNTDNDTCEVDVGLGIITYKLRDKTAVFYKFEPYKDFTRFNLEKQSTLDTRAKERLVLALSERYKEYI